jgi:hypothetical protein
MNPRILVIAALGVCCAEAGETMRCGKWVVDDQVTLEELVAKCGQPVNKESKTEEVRRPNHWGQGTSIVGTTTTERWFYQRSPRAFRMVVTIQDGKIRSIDKAP